MDKLFLKPYFPNWGKINLEIYIWIIQIICILRQGSSKYTDQTFLLSRNLAGAYIGKEAAQCSFQNYHSQ